MLTLSDFDFELPPELIASRPLDARDASRMLVVVPSSPPLEGCPTGGVVRDTVNYKTLPFNPNLKERARELRKSGSLPEALLWKEINGKKLNGLDFDRQKMIGNYIVDFFCASKFLVLEIDDKSHELKEEYDIKRDEYLKSLNLRVIHIPASDVLKNPGVVFEWLSNHPYTATNNFASVGEVSAGKGDKRIRSLGNNNGLSYHPVTSCHPSNRGERAPQIYDKHIRDFVDYLRPGDVVVFNNSRVIPARFMADGKHEITLHTATEDGCWWGLCRKFTKIAVGSVLSLDDGTQIEIRAIDSDSGLKIKFLTDDVMGVLDRVGKMPLPPYMKRDAEISDRERYQTVYADPIGSMAAPTAGLHFTPELLDAIRTRGAKIVNITLHVGAGTWMPVKTENLAEHKMHSEWGCITEAQAETINNATRVIAVGTTSLRLLESAAIRNSDHEKYRRVTPFCGTTDIFITPGYDFGAVDVLLTNFHLPKSTLFMLVSAFAGLENMKRAYSHAVAEKYRFFSYGDCCLLFKKEGADEV